MSQTIRINPADGNSYINAGDAVWPKLSQTPEEWVAEKARETETKHHLAGTSEVLAAGVAAAKESTGIVTPDVIVSTGDTPQGGNGPGGGFSPAQILQAYGINDISFGGTAGNGSGQTIAIVDAYSVSNIASDLSTFDAQFGLPNPTLTVVNETGGTKLPAHNSGWALEETLDVEWAHAIAPDANILLVEANSNNESDLLQGVSYAASVPGVSVVSMSWGSSNPGSGGNFTQTGVTYIGASGDSGAPGIWPAGSASVVAVGGTTLALDSNNNYQSESAWSDSGGGINTAVTEPAYQDGVQNTGYRTIPDVAFDADPNTGVSVYDSGWEVVGGTSVGAPSWAGLVAIIDQGRALASEPAYSSSSFLTALYALPLSDFHDITTGSNGTYSAGPGYDYVTGLGSPVANLLVPALAGPADTPTLTMNLIDGNNYINASEIASGITISGTASDSIEANIVGQTVTVAFNGVNYTGTVTSGGTWSVSIPSSALSGLTDGTGYLAKATITDAADNTASAAHTATVDKTATLTMSVIDGNNYIDGNEYTSGITIGGTANDSIGLSGVSGRTVTVTFNGQTYTGTVSSTGTWSVSVPSSATSALVDGGKYLATAKMTDVAGNLVASVHNVTVDLKTYLVLNPIDGNNTINGSNVASGITINGTATDDIGETGVAGRIVTVTLNGKSYTGTIASDSTWSVSVGTADLSALTDGAVYNVVAAYSDWAGNNVSENRFVTVDGTVVNWGSSSGDWNTASNWQNGVLPGANDLANLNLTSGETVTYSTGNSTVDGIDLSGSGTLDLTGGTLTVSNALNIQSGTLELDSGGTLAGAILINTGGTLDLLNGGTFDNVTVDGTLNMSTNYYSVNIAGSLTVNGTNGYGPGTVTLTGSGDTLNFEGTQTFDNATVTMGGATDDLITDNDTSGTGAVLTLGKNLIIDDFVAHAGLVDFLETTGNPGDDIINNGMINGEETYGGRLDVVPQDFTNNGTINIASSGEIDITPHQNLLNAASGTITVSSDGTLYFGSIVGTTTNAGTINITGSGTLTISSGSFANSGTLNANGGTIDVNVAETPGTGNATISGTGEIFYQGAASDNITFASGATGTLALATAESFTGTITGFTGAGTAATSDKIDLQDISFATMTESYSGNVLTVSDGTHTANITFVGSYVPGDFQFTTDAGSGTLVYDPPVASPAHTGTETVYQKLVQGMASLGASAGTGVITNTLESHITLAGYVANPVQSHH